MATKDERYKQGKIYMIESASTGLVYYGSTCLSELSKRLSKHKENYNYYKKHGKGDYLTSFKVLDQPDYKIVLVEEYPCDHKQQLIAREAYFIRNHPCVNKVIPDRTIQEYNKQYYETRMEHFKEYRKDYYEQNKEVFLEKAKEYRQLEGNCEKAKQYAKQYRQANKQKLMERDSVQIECECGKIYTRRHKSRHLKSAYHISHSK